MRTDPALVAPTIAQVLGVKQQPGQALLDGLRAYLRQKHLKMPAAMTGLWLGIGALLIATFLLVGAFLPRPNAEYSFLPNWMTLGSKQRDASRFALKRDGEGKGEGRASSEQSDQDKADAKDGRGGQGQSGGKQSGRSGTGEKDGDKGNASGEGKGSGKDGKSGDQGDGKNRNDRSRSNARGKAVARLLVSGAAEAAELLVEAFDADLRPPA